MILIMLADIDSICDRFEEELNLGRRPQIETYLEDLDETFREVTFDELLRLEVESRRKAGESVVPEDYAKRFPDLVDTIHLVLEYQWSVPPLITVDDLPRFTHKEQLGGGSFGVVHLYRDELLHCDVAIKFLTKTRNPKPLLDEARKLAGVRHAGIVSILNVGNPASGASYIVMDYVKGGTLSDLIRRETRLEHRRAAEIIMLVADAVHHAHTCDSLLIHRDLKPENILLDSHDKPQVADFGLAISESDRRAGRGGVGGSLAYMAPEQCDGEDVDVRSDVWALGVIFYELIAGRRPFDGKRNEVVDQICHKNPPPLSGNHSTIPKDLERICSKALSKVREDRYSTAGELADALRSWLDPRFRSPRQPQSGPPGDAGLAPDDYSYVERESDVSFHRYLAGGISIIQVRGTRQVGKTSLLARGFHRARTEGMHCVYVDFQKFNKDSLKTLESFYRTVGKEISTSLKIGRLIEDIWDDMSSNNDNLEAYIKTILKDDSSRRVLIVLDEVERLLGHDYHTDFFGLLRSWHNNRAHDEERIWNRLTLSISYATEPHRLIKDPNQSPFNVGEQVMLNDFTLPQLDELNRHRGQPLKTTEDLNRFLRFLGGQPYLSNRGLYKLAVSGINLDEFEVLARSKSGPFDDHLQALCKRLDKSPSLRDAVISVLRGSTRVPREDFDFGVELGILAGDSPKHAYLRCRLYELYLGEILL
jgi:serine/threonine protein kinase